MTNKEISEEIERLIELMTDDLHEDCFEDLFWQIKCLERMMICSDLTVEENRRRLDTWDYILKMRSRRKQQILFILANQTELWKNNKVTMSYKMLSALCGIHLSNISREVNDMNRKGIITTRGRGVFRTFELKQEFLKSIRFELIG